MACPKLSILVGSKFDIASSSRAACGKIFNATQRTTTTRTKF
ncbi:unnamed protein product, partial [Rotaria sp. Silwood2]